MLQIFCESIFLATGWVWRVFFFEYCTHLLGNTNRAMKSKEHQKGRGSFLLFIAFGVAIVWLGSFFQSISLQARRYEDLKLLRLQQLQQPLTETVGLSNGWRFLERKEPVWHRKEDYDWNIPEPDDPKCPSFCGDRMEFEPFAVKTLDGHTVERGVGSKTFFRSARPDLIDRVSRAVEAIDNAGELDTDFACHVFDACDIPDKRQSRHSNAYLVCNEYNWIRASSILQGVAQGTLPGFLAQQGDGNVLCEIANYLADMASKVILTSNGIENKKCVVQEQFINQQRAGAKTNQHFHPDDTYGGLFYLDAPPRTKMCFSNSEGSIEKNSWWRHSPKFTENLFPDAPGTMGDDYPSYFEPRAGDFVLFPVGWVKHWVPHMEMEADEKRTSVVFNLICI